MGGACGTYRREHKCRQSLVGQPDRRKTPGKPGHGWQNNTKTVLKELDERARTGLIRLILLELILKFPYQLDLRIVFSRMKQSVYSRPTDAHQWHMAEGPFIVSLSTTALSHKQRASAGASCDSWLAKGHLCGASIAVTVAVYTAVTVAVYTAVTVAVYTAVMVSVYTAVTVAVYTAVMVSVYTAVTVAVYTAEMVSVYTAVTVAVYTAVMVAVYTAVTVAVYTAVIVAVYTAVRLVFKVLEGDGLTFSFVPTLSVIASNSSFTDSTVTSKTSFPAVSDSSAATVISANTLLSQGDGA